MDNTELKQIVARHFDYAPSGTGQFLNGDWFTPKHKDALQYVLEEVTSDNEDIEELEDKVGDLKAQNELLKEQISKLEKSREGVIA